MNKKRGTVALTALAALFSVAIQQADACTRATYIGPENLVITGRTMDWKEDIMSNIYVFPRGIQRRRNSEMDFKVRQRHCHGL